jgi:hypothetical protein
MKTKNKNRRKKLSLPLSLSPLWLYLSRVSQMAAFNVYENSARRYPNLADSETYRVLEESENALQNSDSCLAQRGLSEEEKRAILEL